MVFQMSYKTKYNIKIKHMTTLFKNRFLKFKHGPMCKITKRSGDTSINEMILLLLIKILLKINRI